MQSLDLVPPFFVSVLIFRKALISRYVRQKLLSWDLEQRVLSETSFSEV